MHLFSLKFTPANTFFLWNIISFIVFRCDLENSVLVFIIFGIDLVCVLMLNSNLQSKIIMS